MFLRILTASTPNATDSSLSVAWSAIALVALAAFFAVGYYLMELRGKKRDDRYNKRKAPDASAESTLNQ